MFHFVILAERMDDNRLILRDARIIRGVDWSIEDLVSGKKDAKTVFARDLERSARIENLEVILAEFNPANRVIGHYTNNERRLLNIPQLEDWWKTDCPVAIAARKKLQGYMEVLDLERPNGFMNSIRLIEIAFESFKQEYEKVCVNLFKLLNDEKELKDKIDVLENRFKPESHQLLNLHNDAYFKFVTIKRALHHRILLFLQRWHTLDTKKKQYLSSLYKALTLADEGLNSIEFIRSKITFTLDRFVNSHEYNVIYSGKFRAYTSSTITTKIRTFQVDLQRLKENIPAIVDGNKFPDVKLLVNGARKYVSEATQVCHNISDYAKIILDSLQTLIGKSNMAFDEEARIMKVMPLYEKDIANYHASFDDNVVNMERLITVHKLLDRCLRIYSHLQKTPEEVEESFRRT